MITDMRTCVEYELSDIGKYSAFVNKSRVVSLATGFAAEAHMRSLAAMLEEKFIGLRVNVYPIKNNFFGEQITVSGLLTGKDICEQLGGKELGDELLIPAAALRAEGDVLLDDVSPDDISKTLGVPVACAESDAEKFICKILGI